MQHGTSFHHVWHCIGNDFTEDIFTKTCHLVVPQQVTTNQCFWERGLLPHDVVTIPAAPEVCEYRVLEDVGCDEDVH